MKITLKAMRVNKGLTQEQLAKQLGVTKVTVMNWEKGNCVMPAPVLITLCSIFGCTMNDIALPEKPLKNNKERKHERFNESEDSRHIPSDAY